MSVENTLRTAIKAQESGRNEEAEKLYWDVLRERPNDVIALYHIGVIRFNKQDYRVAIDVVRKSLAAFNNNPPAHNTLGLALAALGQTEEAIKCYKQAIVLQPDYPDAYNNLAIMYLEQGNNVGAAEACKKSIALQPSYFLTYYNLGVALQRQGKIQEAGDAYRKAIALHPPFPEAYCNLGLTLVSLGKREDAIEAYKQAIAIRPNFVEALNNLGQPLNELGRLEEATEAYRQATIHRPTYTEAFINMAHTLRKRGMLTEAIQACIDGLAVVPTNVKAQIELGNLRRQAADWSHLKTDIRQLFATMQDAEPFFMLSIPSTMKEQHFCATNWASKIPRGKPFVHNRHSQPSRIRIGYLSCDFHLHATAYLMAELFERHDRSKFELFAYAYDPDDGSDIRKRLIKGFDHFIDLHSTADVEAAQRIYNDKINILVDLKGYTNGTRTNILVNRPAPVQVNYIGYPGTMGADFIDYVIGDPTVTPFEHQPFYTERIVQMPNCYQSNDTKRQISSHMQTRAECGLPESGFVFCCFSASYKITPVFFDVWMRLLKAVPGSVLWLISMNSAVEGNLRREAQARGVDPKRLVFAPPLHLPNHLARHKLADLFLDTLPYGAHTTASDALWAGLPFLTCMGETFAGRVGSSALRAVGMPELITTSMAEYEAKALDLASHPEKLAALKQKLAANLPTAPLFDSARYTRDLENAYTRMWQTWLSGKLASPFAVGQ